MHPWTYGLISAHRRRWGPVSVMVIVLLCSGCGTSPQSLPPGTPTPVRLDSAPFSTGSVWLIVVGLFVSSAMASIFSITTATVRQTATPDRLMEPMMAINLTLTSVMVAVGGLAGGFVGAKAGPGAGIFAGSVVFVVTGAATVGRRLGTLESYSSSSLGRLSMMLDTITATRRELAPWRGARSRQDLLRRVGPGMRRMSQPAATSGCTVLACRNPTIRPCAYVDRNGLACPTSWCSTHGATFEGACVCRRHYTLLLRLGLTLQQRDRCPEIDDFAASLTVWISGEFDTRLRAKLAVPFPTDAGYSTITGRVVHGDGPEGPYWTCPWVVATADDTVLTVRLTVIESNDKVIILAVNNKELARGVPPWIERRQSLELVDPEGERADNERFYGALLAKVMGALPGGGRPLPVSGA